jgi:DNA polymerase I-like protein with 3'-5' exonuclease and polymerase domains
MFEKHIKNLITSDTLREAYEDQKFLVFDTETTLINKDKSIFVDIPEFILGVALECRGINTTYTTYEDPVQLRHEVEYSNMIIGHNVAFDLCVINYQHPGDIIVWDTAIAEYEIRGQMATYPSLQSLADTYLYGVDSSKDTEVSEMIKAGVCPKDIPKELLEKYCKKDVILTYRVAMQQLELIMSTLSPMRINLLLERMDWRMTTYGMSQCGLTLEKEELDGDIGTMKYNMNMLHYVIRNKMAAVLKDMPLPDVNPNSLQQLKTVLFGGKYNIEINELTGEVYKTGPKKGEPKSRKKTLTQYIAKSGSLVPLVAHPVVDKLDEPTLLRIRNFLDGKGILKGTVDFIDDLLSYRDLAKNLNTYFLGYKESGIETKDFYVVKSEYKHTATPTGRISSTKPNVQNLKSN